MTKKSEILVSLKNAGVFVSGKWLVRGISFDVRRGEIVTLIGPNGSGKSTSAKMALGVIGTSEGTAQCKPKIRVSYVPQSLPIDWTMPLTVGRFMSLTHSSNRSDIQKALCSTGTDHLENSELRSLSGGEFQRVLLARAIVKTPELLVLDEPVQGVDFNGEIALYRLIEKIRTIELRHHSYIARSPFGHVEHCRVICLNGHVCCSGNPEAVASAPEFRALFGDRAANELTFYRHSHDHEHLPDRTIRDFNIDDAGSQHNNQEKNAENKELKPHA